MSSYTQPSKSSSVFNSNYFLSEDFPLTESLGDQRYVKLQGISNIAGSLTLSGNLTCYGTSTITGNLSIANATVSNLTVTQNLSTPSLTSLINSNITLNNTLTTLRSNVSNLQVLTQLLISNANVSTFSGNLNVGTQNNTSPISYTLGYDNSANVLIKKFDTSSISFTNTTNSYLIVKGLSSSLIGTSNYTIEAWVYINNVTTTPSCIFSGYNEGMCDLSVYKSGADSLFSWKLNNGTTTFSNSFEYVPSFQLNTWTHIAFMYNSALSINKYRYYVNGQMLTLGNNTGNVVSVSEVFNVNGFCLGARYNAGNIDNRLDGFIDEFRISNINRYNIINITPPTSKFTSDSFTLLLNRMESPFLFDSHITPTSNAVVGVSVSDGSVVAYKGFTATMGDISANSTTSSIFLGGNRVLTSSNISIENITPSSNKVNVVGSLFTTANIGIGTTNATSSLHVIGNGRITGNLGIGTTNATSPLHVIGNGFVSGTQTIDGITYAKGGVDFSSGASGHLGVDGGIYKFGGEAYIAADNNIFISNTSGNQKVTFKTDTGRVGIGTSNPAYPFEVVGQNTSSQYSNPSNGKYFSRNASVTNMGSVNTFNCSIMTTGSIWINSLSGDSLDNSFASGNSDRRIKENIEEIDGKEAIEKIRQLKPVYYQFIDRNCDEIKNIGFIAQEVKEVIPIAVDSTKEKFVPNVFKFGKWYKNFINFDAPHGLTRTGKIQVILEKNGEEEKEEWKYKAFNELILEVSRITDKTETVFIYGSYINDFHILAEKPINIMAIAAIKELDKTMNEVNERLKRIEKFVSRFA